MRATLVVLGASGLLLGATPPQQRPVTTFGGVLDGAIAEDGSMWFESWTPGLRFEAAGPKRLTQPIFAMLSAAANSSESLIIRFDPASGRFDPEKSQIRYRLCSLQRGQEQLGSADELCPVRSGGSPPADAAASAMRGIAEAAGWNASSALPLLDRGLAGADLPTGLRATALRARADARNMLASDHQIGSREADIHLIAALEDTRARAALVPDDVEVRFDEGTLLEALGAYEEALRAFQNILKRWPEESYRVQVRIGAVHRSRGDYEAALQALNQLVAEFGPQEGMKYHYHRGWTLTLLERFDEAIAEFDKGLKSQPDYSWAFLRRACANAKLGQIAEARRDQEQGVSLLNELRTAMNKTRVSESEFARAQQVLNELTALERQGGREPTSAPCEGYVQSDARRARSALLPPTS